MVLGEHIEKPMLDVLKDTERNHALIATSSERQARELTTDKVERYGIAPRGSKCFLGEVETNNVETLSSQVFCESRRSASSLENLLP
jgi:hypothetical protein